MNVKCLSIGKTQDKLFESINQLYLTRLKHYLKLEYVELVLAKKYTKLAIHQIRNKEAELFFEYLSEKDFVVLLDERGKDFSSLQLANEVQKWRNQSLNIVFLIGGAYGFDELIYQRAQAKIALSKLTFTHQMVRMIFLEQLYRAHTILNGEKYHHE